MSSTTMRTSRTEPTGGSDVSPAAACAVPGRTSKACGVGELDVHAVPAGFAAVDDGEAVAAGVVVAAQVELAVGWVLVPPVVVVPLVVVPLVVVPLVGVPRGVVPPVVGPPVVVPPVVVPPVVVPPVVVPPVVVLPPVAVVWVVAEVVGLVVGDTVPPARVFSWVTTALAWVWRAEGSGR